MRTQTQFSIFFSFIFAMTEIRCRGRHNNVDELYGDRCGQDVAALGGSGAEVSARRPQRAHKVLGKYSGL